MQQDWMQGNKSWTMILRERACTAAARLMERVRKMETTMMKKGTKQGKEKEGHGTPLDFLLGPLRFLARRLCQVSYCPYIPTHIFVRGYLFSLDQQGNSWQAALLA